MSNGNEAVFPLLEKSAFNEGVTHYDGRPGLTKREYFAGVAMQGMLASFGNHNLEAPEDIATDALQYADALLDRLELPREESDE